MSVWQSDCLHRQFPCISKNSRTVLLELSIVEHGIRRAKDHSGLGNALNSFFFRRFDTIIILQKCHVSQATMKHSGSAHA